MPQVAPSFQTPPATVVNVAANTFGTKTILLIAVYLFATGHPEFIDIALLYALINYLGTIALVNYFTRQREMTDD